MPESRLDVLPLHRAGGRAVSRSPLVFAAIVAVLALSACDQGHDGSPENELTFEGASGFLPDFEQDTGHLPAGSPGQLRVVARAGGGVEVRAGGRVESGSLVPVPGSGELTTRGELSLELHARVDLPGVSYDGPVDTVGYTVPPATATFDPFAVDAPATVASTLTAEEIARLPVPSLPGATVVLRVEGGTLETRFFGTCAEVDGGRAQLAGEVETSGRVELSGTLEVSVPLAGDRTFGPFELVVDVPALRRPIDLGTYDLATGERIEGMPVCGAGLVGADGGPARLDAGGEGGRDGGVAPDDAGPPDAVDAGTADAGADAPPPPCGRGLYCEAAPVAGADRCEQPGTGAELHCCPAGQEPADGRCVPRICGAGLHCAGSHVGGASSCTQPMGGPAIYCCDPGYAPASGACARRACGTGLDCRTTPIAGSSSCLQAGTEAAIYCCPAGRSVVDGGCR